MWVRGLLVVSLLLGASLSPGCTTGREGERAAGPPSVAELADGWPRWGGPNGDFTIELSGLPDQWTAEGPARLWTRDLGPGYSAIAVSDGTLYTMYRDGKQDVVVAIEAEDGDTIWEHRYPGQTYDSNVLQFGSGPNASPLVLSDRLITLGYGGMLHALDRDNGEVLWRHDLIADFDGEVLDFGYSASPVLIEGHVVVLVGGDRQAVVAFDAQDGSVVWSSPPGSVSYATPIRIEVGGRPQIVYFSADEVIGIDAIDGRRLWSHPCVNQYRNNATPAHWDAERRLLWAATQLDGGARVLRLTPGADGTEVEEVWFDNEINIHFWNSVLVDGYVYASIGGQGSILAAIELATGEIAWRERGYSKISSVYTGDRLIFLDEKGHLGMARVSPEGFEPLGIVRVSEETTWTVPAIVGTTLYLRDPVRIMAFDLASAEAAGGE